MAQVCLKRTYNPSDFAADSVQAIDAPGMQGAISERGAGRRGYGRDVYYNS
jgi:hypothetical protein